MPSEWKDIREAIEYANQYSRQPIDLNYIAIPKDIWEDIERLSLLTRGSKETTN